LDLKPLPVSATAYLGRVDIPKYFQLLAPMGTGIGFYKGLVTFKSFKIFKFNHLILPFLDYFLYIALRGALRVKAAPTTMWEFLFALVALCSQIYYLCNHPVAK
jgi:hypothetical protein